MKTRNVIAAILFLVTPMLAQPSDDGPAPELVKLREGYIASLNDLLNQYEKSNNHAGASLVARELDKLAPNGVWSWVQRSELVRIHNDGTVTSNNAAENENGRNTWHWTNQAKGTFQIIWDSGWVDNVTFSPDGETLAVVNNLGDRFIARRLPQAN